MLIRVGAFTPMRTQWPHAIGPVFGDIRIIDKPIFKEDSWRFWNVRRTEEEGALERSHWLCIESDCEWHERAQVLDCHTTTLRNAMLGLQLWAPKGWDGVIVSALQGDGGWTVEGVSFAEPYPMSQWGKMLSLERFNPRDLTSLVAGTLEAFASKSVPIMNPFEFLEIGLQTASNQVRAGALLWTMGLDGLLAAEKQHFFAARLKRLLGSDTLLFPEDWAGRKPIYKVSDVACGKD